MRKLIIEIDGPDEQAVADVLDDVVALINEGCPLLDSTVDGCRVALRWQHADAAVPT